ncbi:MAG: hypothetical protein LBG61_01675 [Burkholderiales bacterium]|jgi:hypothetical protein|nr:hypothetical protein [Burkholderiales bacterium]
MADNQPIFSTDPVELKLQITSLLEYSYSKDKGLTEEMTLSIGAGEFFFEVDSEGHASMSAGSKRVKFKISKDEAKTKFLLGGADAGLASIRFYGVPWQKGQVKFTAVLGFGKDNVLKFRTEKSININVDELFNRTVAKTYIYRISDELKNRTPNYEKKNEM